MAEATLVITYTAADVTGPIFTRHPIVTEVTINSGEGVIASANLTDVLATEVYVLGRAAAEFGLRAHTPAKGIDRSTVI